MTPTPSPFLIRLSSAFNETVMGALALVALATALGPLVFDVGPALERTLTFLEWVLVGMFAAEFVIQGFVAADRDAWLRSPWRIVDVVTILGPIAALLPQVSDVASSSLMFRMLRLGRAVAFGTRAGSVAVREARTRDFARRGSQPVVTIMKAGDLAGPVESDWNTFLQWTQEPSGAWYHASHLSRDRFDQLAEAAGVSEQDISHVMNEHGNAKLRGDERQAVVILQVPEMASDGTLTVDRDRVLAIITKDGVITATTGDVNLQADTNAVASLGEVAGFAFPARVACALLTLARDRNHVVSTRFEEEARRLEGLEGDRALLRDTFRLRREISNVALDLWHLKAIVRTLADGKATIGGVDLKEEKYLDDLLAETESLYEVVNETKEDVKTLIELHINFKSFEMNLFLRLLAVVSFLGLIPSVVGGLLGMNVLGNPWSVTLPQVAFGIAMSMATALYVFAVKGWLK